MQVLELRDSMLEWETERQNRLLKNAAEQKKKQLEAVQRGQDASTVPLNDWIDKVSAIPDIRSALIPLDDEEGWSKPFSLAKADIEPWLSFYKGYLRSRLFLHGASSAAENLKRAAAESSVDYPVRALLELKRVDLRLITAPPVQINGQVAYFDPGSALDANPDSARFRALLRNAVLGHDQQLRLAEEKGRAMGDALHEALMGEGHGNLIKAWKKVFQRKPTIEELHQMLSAGRVRASSGKGGATAETRPLAPESARPAPAAPLVVEKRPVPPQQDLSGHPGPAPAGIDDDAEPIVMLSAATRTGRTNRYAKYLWPLLHAAIACAAFGAYVLFF